MRFPINGFCIILFCGYVNLALINAAESPRPFYLVSHMTNNLEEVLDGLAAGANAIESDVKFAMFGRPLMTFHGIPCDCLRDCLSRTPIDEFLTRVRNIGTPGHASYNPKLTLLYLDLKLDLILPAYRFKAGELLAEVLIVHFFKPGKNQTNVRLLLGFPSVKDEVVIRGFLSIFKSSYNYLMNQIGFEISGRDHLKNIRNVFTDLDLDNVWQGDGVTNCLPSADNRLRQILVLRDYSKDYMNKAYTWTVDRTANMRNALRMNVDALMTNQVARLVRVLEEPEFSSKYRLATLDDDPWLKVQGIGPIRVGCEQDTCWKDCTFDGDWCWTDVYGCSWNPLICQYNHTCSGSCSKRLFSFQQMGNALIKLGL